MIPATFEYARARTMAQALQAVALPDVKVVAGGQTLIPLLRFRLASPRRLVDISGLTQLKGIRRTPAGLRIGAASTYRDLLDSRLVQTDAPLIAEVTEQVGDRQVRNLGTIGGGLAHADPASDMPAVMVALEATFNLLSQQGGKRAVPAREFFTGAFTTAMRPDELLVDIVVPKAPRGAGTAYISFEQPASGYALTAAAALVVKSKGTITHAAMAFTGLADRAFAVDCAPLIGTSGDPPIVDGIAERSVEGVEPNDDIHASAEYRLHLAKVAARRALATAIARAK